MDRLPASPGPRGASTRRRRARMADRIGRRIRQVVVRITGVPRAVEIAGDKAGDARPPADPPGALPAGSSIAPGIADGARRALRPGRRHRQAVSRRGYPAAERHRAVEDGRRRRDQRVRGGARRQRNRQSHRGTPGLGGHGQCRAGPSGLRAAGPLGVGSARAGASLNARRPGADAGPSDAAWRRVSRPVRRRRDRPSRPGGGSSRSGRSRRRSRAGSTCAATARHRRRPAASRR